MPEAEWVPLIVMLMQETFYSTSIYRDFTWTPSDTDLEKIIRRFQKRVIRVSLKPVIDILESTTHLVFRTTLASATRIRLRSGAGHARLFGKRTPHPRGVE